ncbi:23S rRNA (guanosine(2251)-2'-O)-methyltransferase RlmB [Butyricicoccus faecihominis]|uniref:23S rRNA (guanosine(2251)-2'-O)-methyltransferase RlmB n=1 Tax=Butyricicoccus faecihominis TaxID=1712515 RepID=UPI0024793874|nr:23S rRNA (guanosine(2251)-2'-O)-methyltransferase RlmB [Butyricicoccus faecihominis]MCQ5128433.1 23S rRNA (guanosine(2251)-2'-O)-methyltransferase RlmB [Butyricicoccus faecihominis]
MSSGYRSERPPRQDDGTLIEGRNAVLELLRAGRTIDKIFLAEGGRGGDIASAAKKQGVPVVTCDRRKLDHMSPTGSHQGVIAQVAAQDYVALEDILLVAEQRGEPPLLVVCDGIEDPHNLGAIIRSAEAAGAHGIVIPKRRAVGLTAAVARAAAGALAHMGVHKANNLAAVLDELKERGIWLFGAEADGDAPLFEADFDRPCALVIGSEGEGLSRLTREKCDYIVSIPMRGRVNSLNASNAAAVMLFEAVRRRTHAK